MARTRTGKPNGAPKKEIDWVKFKKYCEIFCTLEEIAGLFDVSDTTVERRVKEKYNTTFEDIYKRFSAKGAESLRRMQFKKAKAGDNTMLVWLGKNALGQKDRKDVTTDNKPMNPVGSYAVLLPDNGRETQEQKKETTK